MLQFLVLAMLLGTESESAEKSGQEYPCGVHALYVACRMAGLSCGITDVQAVVEADAAGLSSLEDLRSAAEKLGGYAVVAFHQHRDPDKIVAGSIVHFGAVRPDSEPHFSVYVGISRTGRVILADAPIPPYSINRQRFIHEWTGYTVTVFAAHDDADAYAAKLRNSSNTSSGLAILVVATLVLAVAATLLSGRFWRFRLSRILGSSLFVVLGAGVCVGCRDTSSLGGDLFLPARNIDAGLVPPEGKELDIALVNQTDEVAQIRRVTSTCGCTKVSVPETIAPRSTCMLQVRLQGARDPVLKRSAIYLETTNGSSNVVHLGYATGDLPRIMPDTVELRSAPGSSGAGVAKLWLYAFKDRSLVEIRHVREANTPWRITIAAASGYRVERPDTVRLLRAGLQAVNLDVLHADRDHQESGTTVLQIAHDGSTDFVNLVVKCPTQVAIMPAEAVFTVSKGIPFAGQSRIFIITTEMPGRVCLTECPDFVQTELKAVNSKTWNLRVVIKEPCPVGIRESALKLNWSNEKESSQFSASLRFVGLPEPMAPTDFTGASEAD